MNRIYYLFAITIIAFFIGCENDVTNSQDSDPRDKLVNTWNVTENSIKYKEQSYSAIIEKDVIDKNKVLIYNFFNLGMKYYVFANLDKSKLTIPLQKVNDCEISGVGDISTNFDDIFIEYSADLGDGPEQITAKFTTKPIVKSNINEVLQ